MAINTNKTQSFESSEDEEITEELPQIKLKADINLGEEQRKDPFLSKIIRELMLGTVNAKNKKFFILPEDKHLYFISENTIMLDSENVYLAI